MENKSGLVLIRAGGSSDGFSRPIAESRLFISCRWSLVNPFPVSLFKGKLLTLFQANSSMSPSKSEDATATYPLTATSRVALITCI